MTTNTPEFLEGQVETLSGELNDAYRQIEHLEREKTRLEAEVHDADEAYRRLGSKANDLVQRLDDALETLRHPAVAPVVELIKEAQHEHARAEHAFDERDKANRRWLDLKHGKKEKA